MADESSSVVYMMGNTRAVAPELSSRAKRIATNVAYGFLRRNCRRPAITLGVPHTCSIKVAVAYHV